MKKSRLISIVILFLVFSLSTFPQQQVRKLKTVKLIQKPLLTAVNHWPKWCDKAMKAMVDAVNFWSSQVKIVGGQVNGPSAVATPGCFNSPDIKKSIKTFMISRQVPKRIAAGFAAGIAGQWNKWQSKVTIPGLPLYPAFAAWPGPMAPPTPSIPMPLSAFISAGMSQMSESKIHQALVNGLGNEARSGFAKKPLEKFSLEFSLRFLAWIHKVKVINLMGQGPVPTFAPPYHPAGPVTGGTILPVPGILKNFSF